MLHTVEALERATPKVLELIPILETARQVMVPKKYDCLGYDICFPAVNDLATRTLLIPPWH
jgi:hypothetical protein